MSLVARTSLESLRERDRWMRQGCQPSFVAETSLESLREEVLPSEKRLINADLVAVNQLMPLKYSW